LQTISNLALAYAHLGHRPQLLMALLARETLPLLPQFKPQELCNLLWAMASMEFWHGPGIVEAITRVRSAGGCWGLGEAARTSSCGGAGRSR
jgi:hypothetical protein